MNSILPGPRTTAVLMIVGPLLGIAEALSSPLVGSSARADLVAIAAHPTAFGISATLGLGSVLVGWAGFLGLFQFCARRTPRVAGAAAITMSACMAGLVAVRMSQSVQLTLAHQHVATDTGVRLMGGLFGTPMGVVFAVMFLTGYAAGLPLAAVAAWRGGLSRVGAICLVAFVAAELTSWNGGETRTAVNHLLFVAAGVLFLPTLWRGSTTSVVVPVVGAELTARPM